MPPILKRTGTGSAASTQRAPACRTFRMTFACSPSRVRRPRNSFKNSQAQISPQSNIITSPSAPSQGWTTLSSQTLATPVPVDLNYTSGNKRLKWFRTRLLCQRKIHLLNQFAWALQTHYDSRLVVVVTAMTSTTILLLSKQAWDGSQNSQKNSPTPRTSKNKRSEAFRESLADSKWLTKGSHAMITLSRMKAGM